MKIFVTGLEHKITDYYSSVITLMFAIFVLKVNSRTKTRSVRQQVGCLKYFCFVLTIF